MQNEILYRSEEPAGNLVNRTTFLNARIFDGVQSEYLDESVVVVEGDRIVAVDRTPGLSIDGDVVDVARQDPDARID